MDKYIEGSFMWAVEQMKQGKKVRRNAWGSECVLEHNDFSVVEIDDINATDWEIFEENRFGSFEVDEENIIWTKIQGRKFEVARGQDLDDLEKAIKAAREKI